MAYVGIDTQGARALGQVLRDTATRADTVRRQTVAALNVADLSSQAPLQLSLVQEGLATLGAGVIDKADLAERFAVDPQRTSQSLGASAAEVSGAIAGLLGFAGPRDLRAVFVGLVPRGADAALDAALDRLGPLLLPALLAGQRPELPEEPSTELVADLRLLALRLGIEHVGPPSSARDEDDDEPSSFFGRMFSRRERTGSEVFWDEFWSDGRTVTEVLADPGRLLDWVAGTFALDRRLAAAAGLPGLGDMLATHDFATANSDSDDLDATIAAAEVEFAAIAGWLPAYLVGRDATGPDPAQSGQTLAFAARVGWVDPGEAGGTEQERFAAAVAYLRANRMLQSALLPTGFSGDAEPLAFFNEAGIALTLRLGRDAGVVDQAYVTGVAAGLDRLLTALGVNLSGPPVELTEALQQQLFALVATQLPRSLVESPAIQAQFVASLGFLRQAGTGAEQRQRILDVVAAFRTIAVVGPPALTERQLTRIVGDEVLGVLGRGRLRLRGEDAVRRNPEFLLVARQWGIPGTTKQDIGKYKFSFGFDDLGVLTGIRRKKKSWLSRALDSVKAIGKAILESWKDNPFKAIFQVGKIALGALSLVVPGLQAVGVAALAMNLAETAYHAIEGDWLAALGTGLSAFTAGADIFGTAARTAIDAAQGSVLSGLFGGSGALEVLRNAKRAFDIGTAVFRATQADSVADAIGAGLGAAATALGSGGQLLGSVGALDSVLAQNLVRLGTTVRDVTRLVTPATGLIEAVRRGDLLAAFGSGLSVVSVGAQALVNRKGFLGDPGNVSGTLFEFGAHDRAGLAALAQGTGVAASVARAIAAADAGNAFLAGSSLAQAVQFLNGPRQSGDPQDDVLGDPAVVARRIAEVGVVLEAVFKGASPTAAAPIVVQQLGRVVDALNPAPRASGGSGALTGAAGNDTLAGGVGVDTLAGGVGADPLAAGPPAGLTLAQATAGAGGGQVRIEFPDGTVLTPQDGLFFVPDGARVVTPDGTVFGGGPGGTLPPTRLDMEVPGLRDPVPGRHLEVPEFPGLELFFPGVDGATPQSRNDPLDGSRFAFATLEPALGQLTANDAGSALVSSAPAGSVFGDPTVRTTPFPFVWLPEPEVQLAPPIDWADVATPAFTGNHVLDGGSRTREDIFSVIGWGASARGLYEASESVYVGATMGIQRVDNDTPPVDALTIGGTLSVSGQLGKYGGNAQVASEMNLGPLLGLQLPQMTNDTILGVNIPGGGAVGLRATGDDIRPLEQSDFADAAMLGPGLMLGIKYPVNGDLALDRIAELAEVSSEDVLLAREAPAGTRLAFDVSDEFAEPFDPGFAERPGLGNLPPFEDALDSGTLDAGDPDLFGGAGATGSWLPDLALDGISLDFGDPAGEELPAYDDFDSYDFDSYDFDSYDFDSYDVDSYDWSDW
jgi:hypothetical protein